MEFLSTQRKIIALAAPIDYRDQGKRREYTEEKIEDNHRIMKRIQPFTWRFKSNTWRKFNRGDLDINPIDYAAELSRKRVLLLHGKKDASVNFNRSVDLYNTIKRGKKARLVLFDKEEHLGLRALQKRAIFEEVKRWIDKK